MPQLQAQLKKLELSDKTKQLLKQESQYTVGGLMPLPAFFVEGKGAKLWDVDGKEYLDFIAMFSAVNQGHCHPKILAAVMEQMKKVTLVNLATHNANWPPLAERMCKRFGYDKVTAMCSGGEAADTAIKLARKWGIIKKGIPAEQCMVFGVGDSWHGLCAGVWNLQNPSKKRADYGLDSKLQTNVNPSSGTVMRYGVIEDMEACLKEYHHVTAAVIMECTHGDLPTFEMEVNYARGVYDLCRKYNVLFIADEVRMGAGKTGKFFCHQHLGPDVHPDLVTMAKSITGGFYPASYVLGDEEVMSLVGPIETGATFAYTPLAVAATDAALTVIDEENLCERAAEIEERWKREVGTWTHDFILYPTCRGADMGIFINDEHPSGRVTARKICALCIQKGLLVSAPKNKVRMSVPMVITNEDFDRGVAILKEAMDEVLDYDEVPGMLWDGPA